MDRISQAATSLTEAQTKLIKARLLSNALDSMKACISSLSELAFIYKNESEDEYAKAKEVYEDLK